MNILQGIKTAANVFGEVRKARKAGADGCQLHIARSVPVYHLGYWIETMEGCLFYGQKWQPVRDVFGNFPEETKRALVFTPKGHGEWAERARFWARELKPALPPELYHDAMLCLIGWYAHCLRMADLEAGKVRRAAV